MFRLAALFLTVALAISSSAFAAINPADLSVVSVNSGQNLYASVVRVNINKSGIIGSSGCMGVFFKDFRNLGPHSDFGFVMTAGHCLIGATKLDVFFYSSDGGTPIKRAGIDSTSHLVQVGGYVDKENAHREHDIGIILIKNPPAHAVALQLGININPAAFPTMKFFTITRHESDIKATLSALYALPHGIATKLGTQETDMSLPGTSLLFGSHLAQPDDGPRGSCKGDSGSPVIAVSDNEATLMGPHSGSSATIKLPDGRTCGTSVTYYNATFNHAWVVFAMNRIMRRQNLPYNISAL